MKKVEIIVWFFPLPFVIMNKIYSGLTTLTHNASWRIFQNLEHIKAQASKPG